MSPLVQEINSSLARIPEGKKIIAYTDGSTTPRAKSPNSGSGIFITNANHEEIYSGGLIVRTDGNNFIAEMAAAAAVVKACPTSVQLVLRIDSMATIGAITKGTVSERRRVRAAGRAWMNLCRNDKNRKRLESNTFPHIKETLLRNKWEMIWRTD